MALNDPPDEAIVESHVGRHLFHATHTSRKRSEGDELPGAVGTVLLVLVIAVTCCAMRRQRSKGQRGTSNKIAP